MGTVATSLEAGIGVPSIRHDFDRWMVSEQKRVFLLCYRMLQERDEADSAAQDTFLKAFKALNQSNPPILDDPGKWLTRIAVNTCLDRLRSRAWKFWSRRPNQEDETLILEMATNDQPDAEDLVFAREIAGRVLRAIEQLSPRQKAVFTLRHFEDCRLEEIAEILDLDTGTVKAHMARAVAKMRGLLRDLYMGHRSRETIDGESS